MGNSTKTRILSDSEIRDFFLSFELSKPVDRYYYQVFRLQFLTALRISDLMELENEQISKHFLIEEKKTIKSKKKNKKREVYLCDEAFALANNLAERSRKKGKKKLLTKKDDSSYRRAVKVYCNKAKINPDRVSTHSFRKTMANNVALLKGAKAASKLLNHSNMATTEKYLDESQITIQNAIDLISGKKLGGAA